MKRLLPNLKYERCSAVIPYIVIRSQTWFVACSICLFLLIAGNASARDCEGISIHAPIADQNEVQRVCQAAQDATELLRQCGIESSKVINISIQEKLVHPSGFPAFAFFHSPSNQIEITDFDAFKKLIQPASAYYKLPSRDLYESLIAHEVAHAITSPLIRDSDCPSVAHEYIAAVIQVSSMSDGSRQVLLNAFPRSTPVVLEMFNEFSFYSSPQWFVANAYRHFNQTDKGCELLLGILNGEVQFLCDFEFE